MEHLETQVSDLRAFLPATGSNSSNNNANGANNIISSAAHTPVPLPGPGVGPMAAAPGLSPRHHSSGQAHQAQAVNARSPASAFGGNSALPSPTAVVNTPSSVYGQGSLHHQPQQHYNASSTTRNNSSLTPSSPAVAFGAGSGAGPAGDGGTGGAKRKQQDGASDDAAQKQQRSKRNRYISIACNECKRRKIKCNGETPCQRCGNLNLQCLYAPNCCANSFKESEEFRQMSDSLVRLQEQMESLQRNMTALQQETLRLAPIQDRATARPITATSSNHAPSPSGSASYTHRSDLPAFRPPPLFRGPTSASSHVNVAKNTLHNMGYSGAEGAEDNEAVVDETPGQSPMPTPFTSQEYSRKQPDPLWEYDTDEMIRLCRLHEEEVGIMYPVVNINDVISHAKSVSRFIEASRKNGMTPTTASHNDIICDIKTLELKIIMCCALVVEEHGYSVKASRLWESIQPIADRMLMSDPSEVAKLPFLALVGGYRFLANEDVLAWRVMGQVARLCLEMGLHRRDGIMRISGEQERKNAINTFWSAYVLDRRWSFGTGYPFAVHDDKIDPGLPYPDGHPYLACLIAFAKLSSKIWRLVDYFDSVLIRDLKREDFEGLDREILEWYETVPASIRIDGLSNHIPVPGTATYNIERLQIWTRLRLNQIRIWLYTPVLHTASSITQNNDFAQRVVNLAKETIRYLSFLNNNSIIYRRIQVFYHHFLTSAIAVLFLASTHAPVSFSSQCREEFHMALELIKDLSAKSCVSQRLWRTVKSIKAYAPRLGLQQDEQQARPGTTALPTAGMASSRQNQYNMPDSSASRGSFSSSGRQPTQSPGLPPNGAQQRDSGRMNSLTPRGEGTSPMAASGQVQSQNPQAHHDEDRINGLRLQTEMSKMFEGFANGVVRSGPSSQDGSEDFFGRHLPEYFGGENNGSPMGMDSVYLHMKEMF